MLEQQTLRLLKIISAPFLIVQPDGLIIWANRAMAQLLEREIDELVGKPLRTFTANDGQAVSKLLRLFSSSGNWLVGALKLCKTDLSVIDFPCEGCLFRPATRSEPALISIRFNQQLQFQALNQKIEELNTEIRRRMMVEAALRDSETRIRTLVDCSPLAIQVFAPDGTVIRVNKAWEKMWGTSLKSLRGLNVLKDNQLQAQGILTLLDRVFQGESLEFPLYEYDRSQLINVPHPNATLWVRAFGYPVITNDGRLQEVVLIQENVTDKVCLEREVEHYRHHLETLIEARTTELRRQQTFTEAVLNNISDGIVACDEQGMLSLFNRATIEMHGIDQETLPPEQWASRYRLLQPDGVTLMSINQVPLFRAFEGKPVKEQELVIERADGSKLSVLCSGQLMKDNNGRKLGAVISMHDITLQKHAQTQMLQAKQAAEAANRAKSVFLANVSHELRTPLNAILGFAQLLENDNRIPQDELRNVAIIERAGNHLLALIDDILEISRIEAGRSRLITDTFDLSATLQQLKETIGPLAKIKGLQFHAEFSPDLPHFVMGDEHHLRQVLVNLFDNAIKYTQLGEIHFTVKPKTEQTLYFEIADTGRGIADEQKRRIFEPFYQINGDATKGEGTGLGLSLTQKFISLMGGELNVESTLGQGSIFSFALPLRRADKLPAISPGKVIGLAANQPAPRILLAEDDLDNQQLVKQLLERIGCVVATACNGLEAVECFQSWRPELILMDISMPVMNGYRAIRAIRSLSGGEKLPILALTGSIRMEDRGPVIEGGCNGFIDKPVQADRLYEMMGRMLGLKFDYAETPRDASAMPGQAETSVTLSALPQEIRRQLADSAAILDLSAVQQIAEQLSTDYPDEAGIITRLLENFHFDTLLELCRTND